MLAFTAQTTYASHMAERRGFTIVELVIVMVIMAILLTLTISGVTSGQVSARDSERKADAENIARGLERYYNEVAKPSVGRTGRYPDRATAVTDIVANNALPDVPSTSFVFSFNPSVTTFQVDPDATGTTPAEDAADLSRIDTMTTINYITYVPITWSTANSRWEICGSDEECTRFNLYYRTEKDGVLQKIVSKHQ